MSTLRLCRHPVGLAQVSPSASPPRAEEQRRSWTSSRSPAPFPAGLSLTAAAVGSQTNSGLCHLGGGRCEYQASFEQHRTRVPKKVCQPGRTLRNGRGGEAEPLDLSLRAGPGGEAGSGGALHRCLFCPFATGAPELMTLHLQVHHSRRAPGRRQPRADTSPPYVRAPSGETPPSPPLEEEGSPGLSRSGEAGLGGQER